MNRHEAQIQARSPRSWPLFGEGVYCCNAETLLIQMYDTDDVSQDLHPSHVTLNVKANLMWKPSTGSITSCVYWLWVVSFCVISIRSVDLSCHVLQDEPGLVADIITIRLIFVRLDIWYRMSLQMNVGTDHVSPSAGKRVWTQRRLKEEAKLSEHYQVNTGKFQSENFTISSSFSLWEIVLFFWFLQFSTLSLIHWVCRRWFSIV